MSRAGTYVFWPWLGKLHHLLKPAQNAVYAGSYGQKIRLILFHCHGGRKTRPHPHWAQLRRLLQIIRFELWNGGSERVRFDKEDAQRPWCICWWSGALVYSCSAVVEGPAASCANREVHLGSVKALRLVQGMHAHTTYRQLLPRASPTQTDSGQIRKRFKDKVASLRQPKDKLLTNAESLCLQTKYRPHRLTLGKLENDLKKSGKSKTTEKQDFDKCRKSLFASQMSDHHCCACMSFRVTMLTPAAMSKSIYIFSHLKLFQVAENYTGL